MTANFSILLHAASRLNARAKARSANLRLRRLPSVFFLTDPKRTPNPAAILEKLPHAANGRLGVIFRHFGATDRAETAKTLARLCRKRRFMFLIAADPALAARVGADGVHLPERIVHRAARLGKIRPKWLISAAAHSAQAAGKAKNVDLLLISPVFDTESAGARGKKRLGGAGLSRLARHSEAATYALGGVNARTISKIRSVTGVWGAGLSTGLMD